LQENWEKQQLRLAIHESMAESQERFEAIQASRARLAERLRPMNLERLDTEADGNCQFIALAWSAEAPIDHATLRLQIVQYLQSMERKPFFRLVRPALAGLSKLFTTHAQRWLLRRRVDSAGGKSSIPEANQGDIWRHGRIRVCPCILST